MVEYLTGKVVKGLQLSNDYIIISRNINTNLQIFNHKSG